MVRNEEPYKSFQIYRPVIENRDLRKFLTTAHIIGERILRSTDMVTISDGEFEDLSGQIDESIDEMDTLDAESVQLRSYGIARHRIYDSEKIKLTLFDRRSPVSDSLPLMRLYQHFVPKEPVISKNRRLTQPSQPQLRVEKWRQEMRQAALSHDIPKPEELKVMFDCMTSIPNPGYEGKGREFSLLPDTTSPEGLLLNDEAVECHKVVTDLNHRVAYPTSRPFPEVAFARLPADTPDIYVAQFQKMLIKRLPIYLTLADVRVDI